MYELIKVTENDYYVDCPSKIGIVKVGESEAVIIDSGNNKDAGKKVLKILDEKGWKLKAILNTHSHADHIGGNKLVQSRTGCKVYCPDTESGFINYPIFEPALLYGGNPYGGIKTRFLFAEESVAESFPEFISGIITPVPLFGHTPGMTGFLTKDKTFFTGDAFSSEQTLDKYKIGYIFDIKGYLETLEKLPLLTDAKFFVPSHSEAKENVKDICEYNSKAVNEVIDAILGILSEPLSFETLLKRLFDLYSLEMNDVQYVLCQSTVKSYISYLIDSEKVSYEFKNNYMLFKKIIRS